MSDHPDVVDALEQLRNGATALSLSWKKIGDEGAKAVAAALKENQSLTSLELRFNRIGDEGSKAVAAALKENRSLMSLKLRDNEIGDEGAEAVAAALKENRSLTDIDLSENNIGDEGAKAVAAALKVNWSLAEIEMDQFTEGIYAELQLNKEIYSAKTIRKMLEQISRELGCIHAVNNALSMPSSVKVGRFAQSLLASSNGEQSSKEEFLATQKVELDILEALIVAFSESLGLLGPYIFEWIKP